MDSSGEEFEASDLLWLLCSIISLYHLPFDPGLIAQEFPPSYSRATFHHAVHSPGLATPPQTELISRLMNPGYG